MFLVEHFEGEDKMIVGTGIDMAELKRIEAVLTRHEAFSQRILTENELNKYNSLSTKRKIEYLAGRFAAKEAFSKAKGTGIGKELSFQDIETGYDSLGKPMILKPSDPDQKIHLSISHTKEYALAQVIIERLSS